MRFAYAHPNPYGLRILANRYMTLGLALLKNRGVDMKRKYWKKDGEHWEWEKTGNIYIYGLESFSHEEIERVVSIVDSVIKEFGLPLSIKNGNKHKKDDLNYIEELIQQCADEEGKIDFNLLENELEKLRREKSVLPYGIIILVDEGEYRFKDPEAVYGGGSPEGLIVIRRNHINAATKHEFGHMIGLGKHHENCVMSYACTYEQFCEKCRKKIKEIWEL